MLNQFMNMNDPSAQTKKMTQNRVLLLSQKINNLKFGHKAQSQKKLQSIERTCQQIEAQLENIRNNFDHSCFDIKHLMDKIQKQLNFDYYGTDKMVKDQIRKCEERFIQLTDTHLSQRKKSDSRLAKFVEEKTVCLRDLIQRETRERLVKGQQIEESLAKDLIQIKSKLQEEKSASCQGLEAIHEEFLTEYEKMQTEFQQICQKTDENQNEFYKMLRDILKKVKEELGQDKIKRQEMEQTILTLIEKICDKAIEQVGV